MLTSDLTVAVMVSDASRSATWYEEKLGFRVIRDGHWVTAGPKDAPWRLHICEGKVEPGNTGIGFYSTDIEKEVVLLKRRGVEFNRGDHQDALVADNHVRGPRRQQVLDHAVETGLTRRIRSNEPKREVVRHSNSRAFQPGAGSARNTAIE